MASYNARTDACGPAPAKMEPSTAQVSPSPRSVKRDSHLDHVAASIETTYLTNVRLAEPNATTLVPHEAAFATELKRSPSELLVSNTKSAPESYKVADLAPQQPKRASHVTKPQKPNKKKPTAKKEQAVARSKRKAAPTPTARANNFKSQDLQLQPHALHIYHWGHPIPTDFLNLPESVKAEKVRADAAWAERDTDPELDDWHDFYGLEPPTVSGLSLKQSVGRNFISRAKRALSAGRSWTSFEQEELSIDSSAGARDFKDSHERKIALSTSLDNDLRLYVFEQLKVRLCHEIWLEPYPEDTDDTTVSLRDSVIGTTVPTPTARHKTALEAAIQRLNVLPGRLKSIAADKIEFGLSQPQQPFQLRAQPELPGRDRELHQAEGLPVRISQANMHGLDISLKDSLAGVGLDMSTSDEEKQLEQMEKGL